MRSTRATPATATGPIFYTNRRRIRHVAPILVLQVSQYVRLISRTSLFPPIRDWRLRDCCLYRSQVHTQSRLCQVHAEWPSDLNPTTMTGQMCNLTTRQSIAFTRVSRYNRLLNCLCSYCWTMLLHRICHAVHCKYKWFAFRPHGALLNNTQRTLYHKPFKTIFQPTYGSEKRSWGSW